MVKTILLEMFDFVREKTLGTLDSIEKLPNPQAALAFRPGPGRAHLAWQMMHIAATDDRHLNVRIQQGEPAHPELVKRFAGGSTPDDQIPTLAEIRSYLTESRKAIRAYFESIHEDSFGNKPHDQAPWTFRDWLKLLSWHESHHQGQAHLTLNLFKAQNS